MSTNDFWSLVEKHKKNKTSNIGVKKNTSNSGVTVSSATKTEADEFWSLVEKYQREQVSRIEHKPEEKATVKSDRGGSGGSIGDIAPLETTLSSKFDKYSSLSPSLGGVNQVAIRNIAPTKEDKDDESKLDFFQKGSFDNGYQVGDVTKAILGTTGDAALNAAKGLAGLGEGLGDLAVYGIAGVADALGKDEFADKARKRAAVNLVDRTTKGAEDYLNQYSVLGKTSDAVFQGVGQIGGILATGGAGAAAGLGAAGTTALTTSLMGFSGMGSGMGEAYSGGATDEEALAYGAIAGASDAVTELIFGGLGKAVKATGLSTGLSSADDMLAKKVSNLFQKQITKNLAEYGIKAGAEGFEEVLSGTMQGIGKHITYQDEKTLGEILQDENLLEQFVVGAVTSGIAQVGDLRTANKQKTDFITGQTQNEQAVIQKEVEKRIAEKEKKDGKKLTNKEKSVIETQVEKAMEKGYISIDTIEEAIGGDTYKAYQDTVKREDDLTQKVKTLTDESKQLEGMVWEKMTGEQQKRRDELRTLLPELRNHIKNQTSKRNELKTKLSEEVKSLVQGELDGQGSRLLESYNEVEKHKQRIEVDLNQYKDPNARKTAENLAKVLDNSNKAHDVLNLMTKVSEDRGVSFTAADAQEFEGTIVGLKRVKQITADGNATEYDIGSTNLNTDFKPIVTVNNQVVDNYAIDYKTGKITFDTAPTGDISVEFRKDAKVNGKLADGSIAIDMKSKKYLESLVGHEVTHTLENTDFYNKLQEYVFEYAKKKGEYDTRYKQLADLYNGIEGTSVEAELTADLVGDYLFQDSDFIMNLSTNHRNVFQKIYDEIKYLFKAATAGSEQARRLEQVKKAFETAWRETAKVQKNTADGGEKYSLNIEHTDGTIEELADFRNLTDEQTISYLKAAKSRQLIDETYIPVRKETPQVIIDTMEQVGEHLENRSLIMNVYKARKAMQSEGSNRNGKKHGSNKRNHKLTPNQVVEIINKIDDPVMMIYQTNRVDDKGNPLPNNVAIFVEYSADGTEGFATVEFENPKRKEAIGYEFGEVNFYVVNTAFIPDVERNGFPFDYAADELLENPDNILLEIKRKQPGDSADGPIRSSTTNELLSDDKVAEKPVVVKEQFSLAEEVTEEQNERGLEAKSEVRYSLSHDTEYMDKAVALNNSILHVSNDAMQEAKAIRERIAARMIDIKDRGLVGIPDDIEGNTFIANSSYDGTEENTTICPRSLASEAFTDAVSEYLGRPLTVEEQIYISQDLQGRSLTPECTYCYVATDRKAYRAFLGEYINQRDAVIKKVQDNPSADVSRSGDLYKEFLNGRKDTKPMYDRFKMWVDAYKNGKPMIEASNLANISKLMGDINSAFGAELKPQIVDAMKYAQSASWAKKRVNYVAYNGHILKWKQDRINKLNSHYGLRMYSFSDFHPAFVLENMQMITDASVRGLKMLGYTKDIDFVEIFAPTGMNINVSTFGFETSGNVYENNIIGAEWEKAKALREKYPNVGVTFVATNDNLVNWALDQDWIDVVIPYHLVRTGAEVAKAFGYTNYTSESSDTKNAEWTKGKDKKYISPTEHNNDKDTYLSALEKNHLKPRFERFIDNPNYMKLVNESRQPASQSKPVQPVFNEDAAMVSLAKLEANGYYQPIGGSVDRMYEIAAEVAEDMTKQLAPVSQHSLSDSNSELTKYGDSATLGEEVLYQNEEIAPVAENATTNASPNTNATQNTSPNATNTSAEDLFPDDLAPIQEEYEFLLAEREDIMGAMDARAAVGDTDGVELLRAEYDSVQERIVQIESEDADRLASIDEADAPQEMDNAPEDVADDVPLTKTLVTELAKTVKSQLGLGNNRTAEVRDLIERYSAEKFPSKAHLYTEIAERFGKYTEKTTDDDLKGIKSLLRRSGVNVDDIIKQDIADYGQLMRSNFGKVRFSKEGLPVDTLYQELSYIRPDLFPESISVPSDQLLRIIDIANMDTSIESEMEIDSATLEQVTDTIMNGVAEFKQNRKETLANRHGRESFDSLMESADHYVPPYRAQNIAPTRAEMRAQPDDIAPIFDTTGGQQALMPEPEVPQEETPKRVTRSELHENIMDDIKTTFAEKGLDFDKVLKDAKDLSTFATVDNTPQRVMEKALGYKQGQVLSDLTVNKVAQNETEGIKWLNSFTDKKNGLLAKISKQYHIKPGSKASAAAQMYAEGFYVGENDAIIAYGDKELAADFPDAKVQENIKKLARDPRIRQIYDETLAAINESRARNAYPEIPRLDNYFLHFRAMEDTFSRLGLPFNPNDIRAKDLPTDLNGVTADLKPGQPYFASQMHRKGKRTSFDLLGGMEKYLTSAKNQIYHIDDIQTLRALRNYVAETYGQATGLQDLDLLSDEEAEQRIHDVYNSHLSTFAKFLNEEANVLAGKTSLIDRGLEGVIGRRGITFLNTLNRQVGSNMVGFNVSSSLTNFLAPVQALAKTNKFDFVKAMAQTSANKIGSIFGKGDNFAEESPVMIRRKGAEQFYRTPYQKVADTGYWFMGVVDDISTELIARAKYNEFTRKGMDSQKAHIETDKWVSRLMGDRSLGQQPQLYNSKMLGLFTKFQLEVRNQLDSQFYDTIQEAKVSTENIQNGLLRNAKKAAKITATFAELAVLQHLFGKAFESVAGYNPAFDIIEALIKTMGWDDEEDDEDTVLDNIEQGFLELLGDLPYTSTLTGGRIPISSALPITELIKGEDQYGNEKSRWDTLGEVAPYYILPGGYGQIKKTKAGLEMFSDEHPIAGSYTDSGNLRFPVEDTIGNRVQAAIFGQYASENARDYFDNERKSLKEKQIQEFIDVGMPIKEYWDYREELSKLGKLAEKADYIDSLDLTTEQKNILINNIADRKEDINMSDYGEYGSFEEFDFASKNPEKYAFLQQEGISYFRYNASNAKSTYDWAFKNPEKYAFLKGNGITMDSYNTFDDKAKDTYNWAFNNQEKYEFLKENGVTLEDYMYFDDDAKDAYNWAYNNPDKFKLSKLVSDDVVTYRNYTSELNAIRADKDKDGDSISGSAKAKKIDYINSLNLDYGAKLILFKSEYNADDTYNNEIIEYVDSREDFSFEDKVTILTELGFKVLQDGTVQW